MTPQMIPGFIIFSTALWSGRMPNTAVWSFLELTAGILFIRRLLSQRTWVLPRRFPALLWGLLILWCAASLYWTVNFHATLTSLHKMILISIFSALFLSDRGSWEPAIVRSVTWTSALFAALWIFLPGTARWWSPYPNLTAGFMALAAILSMEKIPFFMNSAAVFLASSLGPVLAWAAGTAIEARRRFSRAAVLFSGVLILISLVPVPHNKLYDLWKRKIQDRYTTERLSFWKDGAKMLLAHPVRGVGMGSFSDAYPRYKSIPGLRNAPYAHNEIVNTLCETGMIGGILGAILIGSLLKGRPRSTVWTTAALAALVQSLFDFNLRYAPITVLFTFCVSTFMPAREPVSLRPAFRNALLVLAVFWTGMAALPGAASILYVLDPGKNAAFAAALDPFNGFYRSRTGKMRDLEIAIALEPANVWYRRQAAHFYISDWQRSGNPASLRSAETEYLKILESAPNVPEFREEYKKFFDH
ncbi:MAG: hypothetical protein A3A86_04815 [Elusimicrobia bacterium RIFCSPLOWO2_01_FULL_60_11]|nr:MAG: hypothetical protein A3A86_04815 [Elusimicrobia bacterium RIFCSPLOWO2_01_FULL_60_11]